MVVSIGRRSIGSIAGAFFLTAFCVCSQEVVRVVEDFEGKGGAGWQQTEKAVAGKGAGSTKDVFTTWDGLALPVKDIPEASDGISFWARAGDGKSAAIQLAMFETQNGKKTEAWGKGFWVTPVWHKYTFPLAGLQRVWAAAGDNKLQNEFVHSVNFQRWLSGNAGLQSKEIIFDDVAFLKGAKAVSVEKIPGAVAINVDASKPIGKVNRFWRAVCVDDSIWGNPYFEPPSGEHMKIIGKDGVFDFVRVSLLMNKPRPWINYKKGAKIFGQDESGKPVYDFSGQDALMDNLVKECKLRPLVVFYTVPKELATDANAGYGNDYPCPPNDYEKWRAFVKTCVRHFAERYGKEEVSKWYWEIWNEPDLWWQAWKVKEKDAGCEEYMKLFDYTAAAITEVLGAAAKIGGPAVAGYPRDYCVKLVKHCARDPNPATGKNGAPLRFLSHHSYTPCLEQMIKLYEEKAAIEQYAKDKDVEVVISEYGNAIFGEDLGTRYQAGALCGAIDAFAYAARNDGIRLDWLYWFGVSRVFGSGADAYFAPDYEGGKDKQQVTTLFLHAKGTPLPKPVYNAYRMLTFMDTEWLEVSGAHVGEKVRAFATMSDDKRRVSVLVYNHDPFDTTGAGKAENVSLTISNLPFNGQVEVVGYLIDSRHSDIYAAWEGEGSPKSKDIAVEQIERIKARSNLEMGAKPKTIELDQNSAWSTKTKLEPHAVALFVLTKK